MLKIFFGPPWCSRKAEVEVLLAPPWALIGRALPVSANQISYLRKDILRLGAGRGQHCFGKNPYIEGNIISSFIIIKKGKRENYFQIKL